MTLTATINSMVSLALAEDIGTGDVTAALIPQTKQVLAHIVAQEPAVICGIEWVDATFHAVDEALQITWHVADGALVNPGQTLCIISGKARSLLTGERTALNFLQLLSGTATVVSQYVKKLQGTRTQLLDTRKTVPGMRLAQKYAVRCGGGKNHRFGLYDMFLIKENHILACGSITNAIKTAKKMHSDRKIEVEVENLTELYEALAAMPDMIMLDNFTLPLIREAVQLTAGRVPLEVSGNITIENIREIAETGVDYISVGSLTKHVKAIDLSLRIASSSPVS